MRGLYRENSLGFVSRVEISYLWVKMKLEKAPAIPLTTFEVRLSELWSKVEELATLKRTFDDIESFLAAEKLFLVTFSLLHENSRYLSTRR